MTELQLCPLRLALPCPAVAPQAHLTMLPSASGLCNHLSKASRYESPVFVSSKTIVGFLKRDLKN